MFRDTKLHANMPHFKKVGMIRERTEESLQRFAPIIKYNLMRDDAIIIKPHCLILVDD